MFILPDLEMHMLKNLVLTALYLRHGASPVGNLAALAKAKEVKMRMMDFMVSSSEKNIPRWFTPFLLTADFV